MPRQPRAQSTADDPLDDNILRLPAPRVGRGERDEHHIDAYQALPGAVAEAPARRPPSRRRGQRARTQELLDAEAALQKSRASRYDRYLDALQRHFGDRVKALADVYDMSEERARAQFDHLLEDVRTGIGTSSVADLLESQDLSMRARVALLKRHAYSPVPAASLKALDMLSDMDGTTSGGDSYDRYVRALMAE